MKVTDYRFREFLRSALVYLLLIGGSLVFMWPFLWMIMASFKTDREMFAADAGFFPSVPNPPEVSPFLADAGNHPRQAVLSDTENSLLEELVTAQNWTWPEPVDGGEAAALVKERIRGRLVALLPPDFTTMPPAEREELLRRVVSPAMLAAERAAVLRTLVMGPLILKSRHLQEEIVIPIEDIDRMWEIQTPERARWMSDVEIERQGRMLQYRFDPGDEIVLQAVVQATFPASDLDEIRLFLRPDDSWHAIRCRAVIDGRSYIAKESPPLSDVRWRTITWKVPAGEPLPANILRNWIDMEREDGEFHIGGDSHSIVLELTLERQSRLQAFIKKAWQNYGLVLEQVPFLRYTATSLFLVIVQMIATMASCSLVAYSFARLRWPGRVACFAIMLGTMMLPGQVTMIPYFLIIKELGWYNTLLPLWVPSLFANAFFVFLLVQFMRGIPRDLEDAAAIDGCGVFRIYWHVMLPLIKPTLAAIAIFTFMGVWNDFMGPLVFLQDQRLYPLSLGLYALNVQSGGGMGMMMAGSFLMTLPVIVIFLFAQRYFLQGITLTGMK